MSASIPREKVEQGKMRLLPPYNWSLRQVATEFDCAVGTVFKWKRELEKKGILMTEKPTVTDWTTEQKFGFVLESANLNELELGEYCREKGVYPEQLKAWRRNCIQSNAEKDQESTGESRSDKKKIKSLEKELARKEKALAETAALLVLREKCNALWGQNEES
jgi:transposase-like protein